MPHTSSAKKSMRQTEKRRLLNKATKKAIRVGLRQVAEQPKDAPADQLKKDTINAISILDKAAAKRRIHPNKAARKKSQLDRAFNKAKAAAK